MAPKWLKIINLITVPVMLFIAAFFWLYVPKDQFLWGVYLIILILLLVGYLNVRKPIIDYIDARTKAKNKPVDAKAVRGLNLINCLGLFAVLVIGGISWFFLPKDQFLWSVICMILILVLVGYLNIRKIISDIS